MSSAIMPTYYNQLPIAFSHGKGIWLWDENNNCYLDSLSGIAVTSLGHAHPKITATICEQAGKLIHTSNTYQIPLQQKLAEKLIALANMEQAFFCNSGAEANEAAIKISRLFARQKEIEHPLTIVMDKAFHGRTLTTATASGERIRSGFEPLTPGFLYAPFYNADYIEQLARDHQNIVAVMLEPIQGEGGIHVPDPAYLQKLRQICDKHDWLLILDEIQTGIGRTGKWFNHQYSQITPDVITVAKALANGFPIGACLARGKACNLFSPGKHGSTFGGNPLACAVALEVLKVIESENLTEHARLLGNYLQKQLSRQLDGHSAVVDIRGQGLMMGIELDRPCRELLKFGLKHGLLFNVTADKVIRLLPPLIISEADADQIAQRLTASINDFLVSTSL